MEEISMINFIGIYGKNSPKVSFKCDYETAN